MKLAIAQLNLRVGDIQGNTGKIIDWLDKARQLDADLVVYPELSLTSYPPEDLLLRHALHRQIKQAIAEIKQASQDIGLVFGLPEKTGRQLFNSCLYLRDGKEICRYRKQELPNYGVFDEKRYFEAGDFVPLFELGGVPTSLSICEDLWTERPAARAAEAGARLLININASPYQTDKLAVREKVLRNRVAETGLNIVYVNLVGGQDELVFDGGSMVIDRSGEIIFRAPRFEEGLFTMDIESRGEAVVFHCPAGAKLNQDPLEEIYAALVLGVRDYVYKNGFKGAVLGLSGGIDSALTLAIAVDALGPENVEVLIMPSPYSAAMSAEDATAMAENLGVSFHVIPIDKPVAAFNHLLEPLFAGLPADATEENIQARCRGILLMALSNKTGRLLLTTGNKSEMAVGYATLYGDMAGGFAPLKDLSKLLTYELSRWLNSRRPVIPQRIIDRPPSAELRPDQKDEDSLPTYAVLDPILERYIERDQSPEKIISAGFDPDIVAQVTRLVDRNEYKRRQAAPGVRITSRAFGRDRRYPITSGYRED